MQIYVPKLSHGSNLKVYIHMYDLVLYIIKDDSNNLIIYIYILNTYMHGKYVDFSDIYTYIIYKLHVAIYHHAAFYIGLI